MSCVLAQQIIYYILDMQVFAQEKTSVSTIFAYETNINTNNKMIGTYALVAKVAETFSSLVLMVMKWSSQQWSDQRRGHNRSSPIEVLKFYGLQANITNNSWKIPKAHQWLPGMCKLQSPVESGGELRPTYKGLSPSHLLRACEDGTPTCMFTRLTTPRNAMRVS